ncbi:SapC family protein [Roseovarius sp.]
MAMTASAQLDTFIVPVTPERHGARRWRRFASYAFARSLRDVPVVMAELEPAASALPLVFRQTPSGWEVVALLSLSSASCGIFVTAQGTWRGTYVPSALRAYPFVADETGTDGKATLMIDEASGLITDDPADEPFFDATSQPSEALAQVVTFFRTRAASQIETRTAARALADAGLLTKWTPSHAMTEVDASGYWTVDQVALGALADHHLAELWRSGALRLAHAQGVSQHHIGWIARIVAAGLGKTGSVAVSPPPQPSGDIASFLSALSDAQAADLDQRS